MTQDLFYLQYLPAAPEDAQQPLPPPRFWPLPPPRFTTCPPAFNGTCRSLATRSQPSGGGGATPGAGAPPAPAPAPPLSPEPPAGPSYAGDLVYDCPAALRALPPGGLGTFQLRVRTGLMGR